MTAEEKDAIYAQFPLVMDKTKEQVRRAVIKQYLSVPGKDNHKVYILNNNEVA